MWIDEKSNQLGYAISLNASTWLVDIQKLYLHGNFGRTTNRSKTYQRKHTDEKEHN
jgi:hypothetical protein